MRKNQEIPGREKRRKVQKKERGRREEGRDEGGEI